MRKLIVAMVSALLAPMGAHAQEPATPGISIVVPFAAGGPTEAVGAPLVAAMAENLGEDVKIEFVPGSGGITGAARVAEAAPDGKTILLYHIGMATGPTLYPDLPFDPVEDFAPIGMIADVPMVLVGNKDLPAKTADELLAYVKEKGDAVTIADAGIGSASHLCSMLFMETLGTQLTVKHYEGTGPAMVDLIAGDVDLICDPTSSATRRVEAGEVAAYIVTSGARLAPLSDVPTAAEAGLASFELGIWYALFAPAGTPEAAVERLAEALRAGLADAQMTDIVASIGARVASPEEATPEGLQAKLEADIARWRPVIEAAGAYAD